MIRNLSLLFFILFSLSTFGQNEIVLSNQNGFEISYRAQKLDQGKKDKWLITVTAVNKTDAPLLYPVQTMKKGDNSFTVNPLASKLSSQVTVRNATGFLASHDVKIIGEMTNLFTEKKASILYQYEPGRIYNYENEINIKSGDTPIVTVTHFYPLKKMGEFNIETSAAFIDGDYKTSCGDTNFSLTLQEQNGTTYLVQSINGKQIKWIKATGTQFTKTSDTNTTLSYNKSKGTFAYSSSDGITCEWTKL
jgi:hypothetical protein